MRPCAPTSCHAEEGQSPDVGISDIRIFITLRIASEYTDYLTAEIITPFSKAHDDTLSSHAEEGQSPDVGISDIRIFITLR